MRLAALTSGGKDSLFAAYTMVSQGFELKYLITMYPESPESYMFHHPNVRFVEDQAKAMGIQLLTKTTKGEKEMEVEDLKEGIGSVGAEIDGVVTGAVSSEYQKQRIDVVCEELGLVSFAPLWHKDPEALLREMLDAGFVVIITATAAEGLGADWLGRRIDERCVSELRELNRKYGVHMSGEGGEYETLVLDMPLFREKLEIVEACVEWEGTSGAYAVKDLKRVKF
jgi:ABC transporter with metal-binding/Fe-S-binding domain ATP-binding protein